MTFNLFTLMISFLIHIFGLRVRVRVRVRILPTNLKLKLLPNSSK